MPQYTPIKYYEAAGNILSGHSDLPHVPPTNKVEQPKQEHWKEFEDELRNMFAQSKYYDYKGVPLTRDMIGKILELVSPLKQQLSSLSGMYHQSVKEQEFAIEKIADLEQQLSEKDKELESWKQENFDNVEMAAETIKELETENRNLQISIATLQKDLDSVTS